jgi:predicted CoA-binding protein
MDYHPGMKTVAIIGASKDRRKYGNKAVRAYLQQGYSVYPVNPNESQVENLPAFKSIKDVPVRPERTSIYVPAQVLLTLLPDIAARGCDELWLNPGTASPEVLAAAERLELKVVEACSILDLGLSPSRL